MIFVVGEALVDLVIALDGSVESALGGAPFNAARAASRLGAPVEFVGSLSRDRFGTLLADQLVADGVGIGRAPRTGAPTTLAAAELDESGAAEYRFYVEGTAAPGLAAVPHGDVPAVFFAGGLGLVLAPMADAVADAVERSASETLVMIDVNCRPTIIDDPVTYRARLNRVLRRADIVKVSDDDLDYLSPGLTLIEGARAMIDVGARAVLVTAGSTSTTVITADGVVTVPVPELRAPVVDTIGAGDTFAGGLLAWWHATGRGREDVELDSLASGVAAAHQAAAVVVTRRGADPPMRSDLASDWAPRRR